MREAELTRLEEEATAAEEKARALRTAIAVMRGWQKTDAQERLPAVLEKATKIHAGRAPLKRGDLVGAVLAALQAGPLSTEELQERLRPSLGQVITKRFIDMATRGRIVSQGTRKTRRYALPGTSLNGTGPAPISITVPSVKGASKKTKQHLPGYVLWKILKTADRAMLSEDILAAARAHGMKIKGQTLGALARYNIIKPAPDYTKNHKTYVIGKFVPGKYANWENDAPNE